MNSLNAVIWLRGFLTHKVGEIRRQLSILKAAPPPLAPFASSRCGRIRVPVQLSFARELNDFPLAVSISRR